MPQPVRRFHRVPVDTVEGTLHAPGDLEILDLSRTGMAFATDVPLEVDASHVVELTYRGQTVELEVEVRWVKEEESPAGAPPSRGTRYRVGVELVEVLDKPSTGIWDWILPAGGERSDRDDEGSPS